MRRPTRRPLVALPVAVLVTASLATGPGSATAQESAPPSYEGEGQVLNVLPPGSRGNVTLADLAALGVEGLPGLDPADPQGSLTTATPTTPEQYADQLEQYDALTAVDPALLTEEGLSAYFKDAQIGLEPDEVVSREEPRPGTTIERDAAGVPHVTGVTYEDTMFGAGFANISDRMFLTDVLRNTGAARMSEFVGPTPANLAMDQAQLRIAAYTEVQAVAQVDRVVERYGAEGERLLRGLDAMIEGMNAAQDALCPVVVAPSCPVEYAALQKLPEDYDRADVVYIASLVGGIFGKGGGGEADNARWLQQLTAELGPEQARRVFDDLRAKNDPEAPTTSPVPQPYLGGGVDPDLPGVALPDLDGETAPGTGAVVGGSPLPSVPGVPGVPSVPGVPAVPGLPAVPALPGAAAVPGLPGAAALAVPSPGVVDGPFGPMDLGLRPRGMSNALLVDAEHSADGHPTVVFGPQTGYFTPQLLVEQSLSGPGVQARGVSFAGTNLVVELGRGVDYAWSATSASHDIVDTVVERLCEVDGSAPTVESEAYLVGDTCTPMESRVHSQTVLPSAAAPGVPQQLDLLVLKTRHGVVQLRTTVDGAPVAVVLQRSTFDREVDSVVGFSRLQDPDQVRDADGFQRAVAAIDYTFNWFYADDRDISFFSSGLLPDRAPGWDRDLPRFGDLAYDDVGVLPFEAHPRVTDPDTGFLVSWNNKPAPGFSAADDQWGYGPVYRSLALEDRVRALTDGGQTVTRAELVGAMAEAATVDVRGAYALPVVLDLVGTPDDPRLAEAVQLLRTWVDAGAPRLDRDRDGAYSHPAAIALLDAWWEPDAALPETAPHAFSLPRDVLRGGLGDLVDDLPRALDDHPRLGQGSAFNGVAWYGYVSKDLRALLGRPVDGGFSRSYCGDGDLERCREQVTASLAAAVDAVTAAQGVEDPQDLTYDKGLDAIRASSAGLVGSRAVDWQNRPTFQQVVQFTSHRPRAASAPVGPVAAPVAAPLTAPAPVAGPVGGRRGTLAATGAPLLLPVAGLALLVAAGLARRRTAGGGGGAG